MATATETKTHSKIPYIKIAKMYGDMKSYEFIAKHVGRYNEDSPDPTKTIRAVVSRMLTEGFVNEDGKVVKLKRREGSRGMGTKVAKKTKVVATKAKAVKVVKTVNGKVVKAIAIILTEDGKHVKLTVPSLTNLIPIGTFTKKFGQVVLEAAKASEETAPVAEATTAPEVPVATEEMKEAVQDAPVEKVVETVETMEQVLGQPIAPVPIPAPEVKTTPAATVSTPSGSAKDILAKIKALQNKAAQAVPVVVAAPVVEEAAPVADTPIAEVVIEDMPNLESNEVNPAA